ncbi:MAG: hypothetical protein MRY32_04775 [Rickettsiales bacterium]|nr:hypothetical protein [Rickettsiales bacterium]
MSEPSEDTSANTESNAGDVASESDESSRTLTFVVPLLILIILIAGVGYFATTQTGLDKATAQKALDGWAADLKAATSKDGSDPVVFTYETLEMAGAGTSRHVVLTKPSFETRIENDENSLVNIRAEQAMIYPESVMLDAFRLELPAPLTVASNGVDLGRIITDEPLVIHAALHDHGHEKTIEIDSALPRKVEVDSFEDDGLLTITMNAGGAFKSIIVAQGNAEGMARFDATGIRAINEDEEETKIGKLLFDMTDKMVAEDVHDASLKLDMQQIEFPKDEMPYGAISVNVDMTYDGELPNEDEGKDWASVKGELNIHQFQIKNDDTYLSLKGKLASLIGDILPVGNAQLKIGNFAFVRSEMEKFGVIPDDNKQLANILFEQITGEKMSEAKDVDVILSRPENGSLKIGHISFEQALAIVLTGGKLLPKETTPAPAPVTEPVSESQAEPSVPVAQ